MRLHLELRKIRKKIDRLIIAVDKDKRLPRQPLLVASEFNMMRSAVVALDTALHRRHRERHPMPKIPVDMSPTKPLDPDVRADIDSTP